MREVKELQTNGHGFNFKLEEEVAVAADGEIKKAFADESEVVSAASTFLSLLATKDRDFLLSPSGTQVYYIRLLIYTHIILPN